MLAEKQNAKNWHFPSRVVGIRSSPSLFLRLSQATLDVKNGAATVESPYPLHANLQTQEEPKTNDCLILFVLCCLNPKHKP